MTVGGGHTLASASSSMRGTPKTWSMWPWEYTAVSTRSADQRRSSSRAPRANNWLPVSTSTRPSSVETALTLAKEGTKAQPSATSATEPRGANGCACSIGISPRHSRSATSSTSSSGMFLSCCRHLIEHEGPRHVDAEKDDQRQQHSLDSYRCADVHRHLRGAAHEDEEDEEEDRRRRPPPP